MSATKFLKNKEILKEGFEKWIVKFSDKKEFNIVDLMEEYSKINLINFLKWINENDYIYSRKFKMWQKSFINETLFYSEYDLYLIYKKEKQL